MSIERFTCPIAVHLILKRDSEILFQLRKDTSFSGYYGLVAGHLDGGEQAIDALIREAKEEINIDIKASNLKFMSFCHSNAGGKEYSQLYFLCEEWSGEVKNNELDKCRELKFFEINNLPKKIVPYLRKAIDNSFNGIRFYEDGF